ncbi:hypothetical protein [uncultured Psychromonas sp.]|uniref:hypothetical protein n=1 Tax=uncultured Psychromonas sp. TaxID=173974 RepID=UPI0026037CF9|nr:hypothetical protein [uncultured Psychromonas sp.]
MDVPQESVRYKSDLLFGSENDPVSVSLAFLGSGFFSGKRKPYHRQGEITDNKYQADRMSADEPNSKQNHSKTSYQSYKPEFPRRAWELESKHKTLLNVDVQSRR